ncbi:MAG: glycosyltransferase [Candidatus Saccharimonadales bacterium]
MNTAPLRIGIFTDDFYPNSGGVARSIELQISELHALGHDVVLFAPRPFFVAPTGIKSEVLDSWHIHGTPSFLCSLKFGDALAEDIMKRYTFDIVHSQNERGAMFLAAKIAKKCGIPHVHTFHSNYAGTHRTAPLSAALNTYTFMKFAPFMMKRIRSDRDRVKVRSPRKLTSVEDTRLARFDWKSVAKLARFVDAFTSPAEFVINNINDATRGLIADRGFVIPNGINDVFRHARRIRSLDDTIRFLSCGRLDPEKRVDIIIRAFAALPECNAELYILGTGTEESSLKQLAHELRPRNRIQFLGHFEDHERVANEFANSDVFVFASYRFDTQGMVLAEAASAGAAILYCDNRLKVGVTDKNSLLINHSVSAFKDGMHQLLTHPSLLRSMQQQSKLLSSHLTAAQMCQRFLSIYNSVSQKAKID